jgi:glutaredoxin 3
MPEITIYTTAWCGYCRAAKQLLEREGLRYEEIALDDDPSFRQRIMDITGDYTVPQLIVDGESIGGFHELAQLVARGELDGEAAPAADPSA